MPERRWVIIVDSAEERHESMGDTVYSVWTQSLQGSPDDDDSIWVHVPGDSPAPSGICVVERHPSWRMVPEYRLVDRLEAQDEAETQA